jgi:serine O-acetyltransferase
MLNAIHLHRVANALHRRNVPVLPKLVSYLNFLLFNSAIPAATTIGAGTRFAYGGIGVVIHKDSVIGRDVTIGQGITIGGRSRHRETPIIGDRVYIGAGARVLGPIKVGEGSIIGPNAVVLADVPPRSIVVGVPARIIRTDIEIEDYI